MRKVRPRQDGFPALATSGYPGFFSPFSGPFGGLGAFLGVHGAEESQRIPPGAESLGAGGTQAARGWRAAPAPAPTRQMASLSPCDRDFFFIVVVVFV